LCTNNFLQHFQTKVLKAEDGGSQKLSEFAQEPSNLRAALSPKRTAPELSKIQELEAKLAEEREK
jgi:hypothetical protein